jgi:hypothetical protein
MFIRETRKKCNVNTTKLNMFMADSVAYRFYMTYIV